MSDTTWDPDKGPTDEQVDDALRVLRAEYWSSIRAMAKDLVKRVESGEIESDDDMSTAIHEDADGSYWTIYTHANYRAIMCSDADPYALAEDAGFSLDEANQLSSLAYLVVQNDVTEQVEAELGGTVEDYLAAKEEEKES